MPNCTEMKAGEVYVCSDCGLELQVVKSCTKEGSHGGSCSVEGGGCVLRCCDEELVLKKG
jgi:hypothetical protein